MHYRQEVHVRVAMEHKLEERDQFIIQKYFCSIFITVGLGRGAAISHRGGRVASRGGGFWEGQGEKPPALPR